MKNFLSACLPRSRRARVLLGGACLYLALACAIAVRQQGQDPGGWWEGHGPVVAHDTFPSDCFLCHTDQGWNTLREDFEFDHEAETGVALTGAHESAACLRCHNDRGPVASFAARGCAGCHEDVHRGQLGPDCKSCHDETEWGPFEEIALHQRTRFPLVGAHAAVACWQCHVGAEVGNFTRTDTDCATCHQDDLAVADDPDHMVQGWVQDCDQCHIPTAWDGANFNHPGFALTGAHLDADCTACHTMGGFGPLPSNCDACHLDEYTGAMDPMHSQPFFPLDCARCHGTDGWEGANFNHFGISSGCAECHQQDYDTATDPNHVAGNFPDSCELCHGTNTWEGAFFSHAGISTGCAECHQDDYDATSMPNHVGAGFPDTCETCHGTNMWEGAIFNHSFPINSGAHKIFDCIDCHTQPRSPLEFTCITCHGRNETNKDHDEVQNYVYASPACLDCHPNGKED